MGGFDYCRDTGGGYIFLLDPDFLTEPLGESALVDFF